MAPLKGYLLLAALTSSVVAQYEPYDSDELFARELVYDLLRREPIFGFGGSAKVHPAPPSTKSGAQPGAQSAVQGLAHGAVQGVTPAKKPGMLDRAKFAVDKATRNKVQKLGAAAHPEYDEANKGKTWDQVQKERNAHKLERGVSKLTELGQERKNVHSKLSNERNKDTYEAARNEHDLWVHKTDKLNTGLKVAGTVAGVAAAFRPRDLDDYLYGGYGILDARDLYDEDLHSDYGLLDARDLYDDDVEFIWV